MISAAYGYQVTNCREITGGAVQFSLGLPWDGTEGSATSGTGYDCSVSGNDGYYAVVYPDGHVVAQ